MKTLRFSVIPGLFALTLAASAFQAQARSNKPVYHKAHNASIGITVDNATGASYVIKDEKGNIVLRGIVRNDKTFFIPTAKLDKGNYRFFIGSMVLQEFAIG